MKIGRMFSRPVMQMHYTHRYIETHTYLVCITANTLIIDSKLSLKTSNLPWLCTMKAKLLCTGTLSLNETHEQVCWRRRSLWHYFFSATEMSSASSTPDDTTCHTDRPEREGNMDTAGLQAGIPHWVMRLFISNSLQTGPHATEARSTASRWKAEEIEESTLPTDQSPVERQN